eukprot:TRINITY_DN20471_c0_g2_i2.p1 TRINITY_DN20471_c0_g2~~TRINITY_DN20471_c0_g2_i2.p1  ORF type:complete len:879 (+),score=150.97 TRINITY_DN20471_c0_g2_i2:187-2823(+)
MPVPPFADGTSSFATQLDLHWTKLRAAILQEHFEQLTAAASFPECKQLEKADEPVAASSDSTPAPLDRGRLDSRTPAPEKGCGHGGLLEHADSKLTAETVETGNSIASPESVAVKLSEEDPADSNWAKLVTKLLVRDKKGMHKFVLHHEWKQAVDPQMKSLRRANRFTDTEGSAPQYSQVADPMLRVPKSRCNVPTIHPNSRPRFVWILLLLLFCLYDVIRVPIDVAFEFEATLGTYVSDFSCAAFWSLDIAMNFMTGVYHSGTLLMDPRGIACAYLKRWFVVDVALVTINWFIVYASSAAGARREYVSFRFLRAIRVLQLLRLMRGFHLREVMNEILRVSVETYEANLLLFQTLLAYSICVHLVACTWFRLQSDDSEVFESFVSKDEDLNIVDAYLSSAHWALSFLLGSSVQTPVGLRERAYSAVLRFLGMFATAFLLAKIAQFTRLLEDPTSLRQMRVCHGFLQNYQIMPELAEKVKSYVQLENKHSASVCLQKEEQEFLLLLPKDMQLDLSEAAYGGVINRNHFFSETKDTNFQAVRKVVFEAMSHQLVKKGERVFTSGYAATHMFFVLSGQLSYVLSKGGRHLGNASEAPDIFASAGLASNGDSLCEPVLWTKWLHLGRLTSPAKSHLIMLNAAQFRKNVLMFPDFHEVAKQYGRKFVHKLNASETSYTDLTKWHLDFSDLHTWVEDGEEEGHYVFISHYKLEAGTEAVLVKEALVRILQQDPAHRGNSFKASVFLDSENLSDLTKLKDHVIKTENLVLLLTPGLFTRPWCLLEIVTALRNNITIVPVEVQKPGSRFTYPDEHFYEKLREGSALTEDGRKILANDGVELSEVEAAVRHVFTKIALTFSPHKSSAIREAEMQSLMDRCSNSKTSD